MLKRLALVLSVFSFTACAGMRAYQARQSSLQASLNNHTLASSSDDVLNSARLVLVEQGFTPKDVGPGVIETDYKSSSRYGSSSSSSQTWKYTVTVMTVAGNTKLVAMRNGQASSSGAAGYSSQSKSSRDYDLELDVLRRVEPTAAARFEQEADARAQAARDAEGS